MASSSETLRSCPFGFSCRDMFQLSASISADQCENFASCKSLSKTDGMRDDQPDTDVFSLSWVGEFGPYTVRVTRSEAAATMLRRRGAPQSVNNMDVTYLLTAVLTHADAIQAAINAVEQGYIAPDEATVHTYHVYRPSRPELRRRGIPEEHLIGDAARGYQKRFTYNKMTAQTAIFAPAQSDSPVKVIHLSHNDDARTCEAKAGIDRRNKLHHAETLIRQADVLLREALTALNVPPTPQ